MSQIHLNRAGQKLGHFTLEEIQQGIQAGRFIGSDLAWQSGMETWKPLSAWPEITLLPETPEGGPVLPPSLPSTALDDVLQDAPAWEEREQIGYLQALGLTIKQVLLEPAATFARLRPSGGLIAPMTYYILTGVLGGIFSLGYQFMGSSMGLTRNSQLASLPPPWRELMAPANFSTSYLVGALFGILVIAPILLVIVSFVHSGITHLCLMILGGAKKPFEVTYRVMCYAWGSCRVLSIVPVCGELIGMIWALAASAIGLAKTHETEVWRTTIALLLPALFCCGVLIAALASLGAMFASMQR